MGSRIIRFTIFDEITGLNSATWTCYTRNNDVYIFCRSIGSALKLSIHTQTGQCHLKYQPEFAKKNVGVIPGPYIDKWTYEMQEGRAEPVQIVTPRMALDKEPESEQKQVLRIPTAPSDQATFIRVVIVSPGVKIKGESIIEIVNLDNGNQLVLASGYAPMPELRGPHKVGLNLFRGQSLESIKGVSTLRFLLLAGEGASRQIFDLVLTQNIESNEDRDGESGQPSEVSDGNMSASSSMTFGSRATLSAEQTKTGRYITADGDHSLVGFVERFVSDVPILVPRVDLKSRAGTQCPMVMTACIWVYFK